jgi:hypothetical protein
MTTHVNLRSVLGRELTFAEGDANFQNLQQAVDDISATDPGKGADLVGYLAPFTGAVARTQASKNADVVSVLDFYANGVSGVGVDPTGVVDSTLGIQAALNLCGGVYLPAGTYKITAGLVIKGYTRFFGDGPGKSIIKLATPSSNTTMLVDSSIGTPSDLNPYITIEGLEFDGNSYASAYTTACLNFFRVKNVNVSRCYFHDTSGTPVNILGSQTDSYDINVTECIVANSKNGDAFAFSGTHINVYKCVALNFKDTGFAILQDIANRYGTNPATDYPRDITFTDCRADGTTNALAAGFAFGPFINWNTLGNVNIRIIGCTTENCNVALWGVATNGIIIENCNFTAHKATDTGNVRLDGCSNLRIKDNTISMAAGAGTSLYSALLIQAGRFTYGASKFDADVFNAKVQGNRFNNSANNAIICTFEMVCATPSYTSEMSEVWVSDNYFEASTNCVYLQPQTGSTASVCNRINVTGNCAKNVTTLLNMNGATNQYTDVLCSDNKFNGTGTLKAGTGSTYIFQDSPSTWTPTFTGLTVVPGTGAVTITGTIQVIGKMAFVGVAISNTGTCTTSSGGPGTTYINNLPVPTAFPSSAGGVMDLNTASSLGDIAANGTRCDVAAWSARGDFITISAIYPIA